MKPFFHILEQYLNSWKKSWRKLSSERRSERKYRCHFKKVITFAGSPAEEALHIQKSRRRSFPLSLSLLEKQTAV